MTSQIKKSFPIALILFVLFALGYSHPDLKNQAFSYLKEKYLPFAQGASPYQVFSQDGLTLSISDTGKPESISVSGSPLPMLSAQGGFSFKEISSSDSAPNLILNPGFEAGTTKPDNWSLSTNNGNTPVWDNAVSHTGSRSIKISIPGTADVISGNVTSGFIKVEPLAYYTFSAWGKTESIGGTYAPAVRLVEADANKTWLRQTSLVFSKGTNDWVEKKTSFQTGSNTAFIYVYINIYKGYGAFWADDIKLSSSNFNSDTSSISIQGTLTKSSDGSITQKTVINDLDFVFQYIPGDKYIEIQADIQNLNGNNRAL